MIRSEDIPDEVVKAAAMAAYDLDAGSASDTWEQASKLAKVIYLGNARASIAAAINAWPGVSEEEYVTWPRGKLMHLILPLPQKGGE